MRAHPVDPPPAWPDAARGPVSLADVLDRVRDGRTSVADEVERALEHVRRTDDVVRAWVCVDEDGARRQARRLDDAASHGLPLALRGAVVGVKDVVDVGGLPTRAGSALRASWPDAERDAAVVALLREHGAVVLGKTATAEYAYLHPPATRNPRDLSRTPGGSSSGSAAAVAAGSVTLAVGTQTAGSIVRPAAFCGVAGLKPTFGRLSLQGVLNSAPSLDTVGLFAASGRDLLPVARALLGHQGGPERPRALGWWPTTAWDRLDPDARDALEHTLGRLAEAGVPVRPLAGPDDVPLMQAQRTLMTAEVARGLAGELAGHEPQVSEELRALLAEGRAIAPAALDAARAAAAAARADWDACWGDLDAILTPATLGPAPEGQSSTGDPALCRVWTMVGYPALALPVAATADGRPTGLQLIGRPGADARLIALGAGIEAALAP